MTAPAPLQRRQLRPPEERGRLDIHPSVLRRIVEHAADSAPGTARHGRRLAGIDVGEVGAVAKVVPEIGSAGSDDTAVDVSIDLTLQYPSVVRTVVEEVRDRVSADLDRLAGYRVHEFSVTVTGFRSAGPQLFPRVR